MIHAFLIAVVSKHRMPAVVTSMLVGIASPTRANAQSTPPSAPVTTVPAAPASPGERCLQAHREGQELRRQSRLLESRDLFNQCSDAACPGPVRRDCQRWVDEVANILPSVVFSVDGDDPNARFVKIFIDGELRFDLLPKRAVEMNPGTYRFRFVMEGKRAVEQAVALGESDKLKPIVINFDSPPPRPEAPPAVTPVPPPTKPVASPSRQPKSIEHRPTPLGTYMLAGLGAAATINFAAWGLSSKMKVSDLDKECAPDCDPSDVDRARTHALIADVSLGVGIAAFTTATLWYLLRPSYSTPVEVDVGVVPRGGLTAAIRLRTF